MNTNAPWRTFSIFISSTFADMQAERDHLKNIVFPRIEEELRKNRIRLETVDLRWGVDTASVNEDEREATVLKVCLEEIDRCKPFFIGLLGDRYGWVPPEERIENATIGRELLLPNKGKSVTALEIEFGVLASTKQLNRSVFYLREPLPYEKLSPQKVAKFSDQYDPNLSEEEKKIRKEALDSLKQHIKSHYNRINLPEKVKTYTANLNPESGADIYCLEPWGEEVYKDILTECEKHAEDTWGEAPKDQHEEELALLEAFIEEHTHVTTTVTEKGEEHVHTFCGRKKLIGELREHLLGDNKDKWGIVLTGESGSGKSAVFSMMYNTMIREGCFVLAHSAGISPNAKSVAELLRKWNRLLREFLGIEEEMEERRAGRDISEIGAQRLIEGDVQKATQKTGVEKLQEQFSALLYQASEKKRIVLLVDALDRLEPTSRAQYMTWLPDSLPGYVKLLVTAITGTEKNAVQYHKGLITRSIEHFTWEEAREMLYSLGRKQHKSLPKAIEKEILEKTREDGLNACSSPLWLSLAVNILMALDADDFERMSRLEGKGYRQIESYMQDLAKQFPVLPGDLFLNLIEKAAGIFGEHFTTTIFNLIACSRGGLRESDLEQLLPKQTSEAWDPLRFAGLRRWFRIHLVEQGEGYQWNLAHSLLRNAIRTKMSSAYINQVHTLIIIHLFSLPATDALGVKEIMFHLLQIDDKKWAIEYYTLELEDVALTEATKVLCEIVSSDEKGTLSVASFPDLVIDNKPVFIKLSNRFIFDLNNLLKEEGNINQRLTILTGVYETLEKCSGNHLNSDCLGYNKAVLLGELGFVYEKIGKLEEALNFLFKSLDISKEFYESDPNNELNKQNRATFLRAVGSIYQKMGQFQKALKYYGEGMAIEKEIIECNPHNDLYKINLARSYDRIGYILQVIGQLEDALNYFLEYQKTAQELYKANPHNDEMVSETAICFGRLGEIYRTMGQMKESLFYFKKCSRLGKEILNAKPFKFSNKYNLATSYEKLGSVYEVIGQIEEAIGYFIMNNELLKALYNDNPLNESLKYRLAISYEKIGSISQEKGHIEEALFYFQNSAVLFEELHEINPLNESHKFGVAAILEKFGNINRTRGHLEEALDDFQNAAKLYKELYETNPKNIIILERQGILYLKIASIHKAMGNDEKGKDYFSQWKDIISFLIENLPQVPKYIQWNEVGY